MKPLKLWIAVVVALAAIIALLTHCRSRHNHSTSNSNSLVTLRIADTRFMGILPLYVADEKGIFKRHGIEIKWLDVRDPGQAQNLFFAGQSDYLMTTFPSILPAEARAPGTVRLLCPTYESAAQPGSFILVPPDSSLHSLADLKGKTLGTYNGASQKAYALMVLKSIGLREPEDVQLVQVASNAQVQGLFGKSFDALFTVEPYGTSALARGARSLEIGVRTKHISSPFWVGAGALTVSYVTAHPAVPQNLLASLREAIEYISQHDEESREILARKTGIDQRVAAQCALYTWCPDPSAEDMHKLQAATDMLTREKLLDKPIDMTALTIGLRPTGGEGSR